MSVRVTSDVSIPVPSSPDTNPFSAFRARVDLNSDRLKPLHVVWDLDRTLVSSLQLEEPREGCWDDRIEVVAPNAFVHRDARGGKYYTQVRKHTRELLDFVSTFSIMYVFTASTRSYMKNILGFLDPENVLFHSSRCLSRSDFRTPWKLRVVGKDFKFFQNCNIPLSRAVLVDDQLSYHRPNPANGLLVSKFRPNTNPLNLGLSGPEQRRRRSSSRNARGGGTRTEEIDTELIRVGDVLSSCYRFPDVRLALTEFHSRTYRRAFPILGLWERKMVVAAEETENRIVQDRRNTTPNPHTTGCDILDPVDLTSAKNGLLNVSDGAVGVPVLPPPPPPPSSPPPSPSKEGVEFDIDPIPTSSSSTPDSPDGDGPPLTLGDGIPRYRDQIVPDDVSVEIIEARRITTPANSPTTAYLYDPEKARSLLESISFVDQARGGIGGGGRRRVDYVDEVDDEATVPDIDVVCVRGGEGEDRERAKGKDHRRHHHHHHHTHRHRHAHDHNHKRGRKKLSTSRRRIQTPTTSGSGWSRHVARMYVRPRRSRGVRGTGAILDQVLQPDYPRSLLKTSTGEGGKSRARRIIRGGRAAGEKEE